MHQPHDRLRATLCYAIAALFLSSGTLHFARSAYFVAIVPPYLPWPLALVYISGVFELLGAIGLLWLPTRRWASLGLILLSIAVFPANLHMALHPDLYPGIAESLLWLRLPLQPLLILALWWSGWAGR